MGLSPDLEPFRRAVRLRNRCREAALAKAAAVGVPLTGPQVNLVYDVIAGLIREAGRPHIRIDPAQQFGRPNIKGVSVEAIVGMYLAGEDPETVCDEYDLTMHEFVLACWHEAVYGGRTPWKVWAERVERGLGGWKPLDLDDLPEDPDG